MKRCQTLPFARRPSREPARNSMLQGGLRRSKAQAEKLDTIIIPDLVVYASVGAGRRTGASFSLRALFAPAERPSAAGLWPAYGCKR